LPKIGHLQPALLKNAKTGIEPIAARSGWAHVRGTGNPNKSEQSLNSWCRDPTLFAILSPDSTQAVSWAIFCRIQAKGLIRLYRRNIDYLPKQDTLFPYR
jgi:hypothetical protein